MINRHGRAGLAFLLPGGLFLTLFLAYPVFETVRLSLVSIDFATDRQVFVGLDNFVQIARDPKLPWVAANTAIWTLGSLAGQFGLGLAAALCISRDLPGMR